MYNKVNGDEDPDREEEGVVNRGGVELEGAS